MFAKRSLAVCLFLILAGCGGMTMDAVPEGGPRLLPEDYFLGRTKGWGLFVDRFGRIRRQFQVDIVGERRDDVLTLTEDFVYADGEKSRRIWTITVLGDGRYQGRADDVVGVAEGEAKGTALHWRYDLNLLVGGSVWRVHFDDWMLRQDENVVINRAVVTKFGLTLGEVILFFQKEAGKPSLDATAESTENNHASTACARSLLMVEADVVVGTCP